jgi:hypothetical protein
MSYKDSILRVFNEYLEVKKIKRNLREIGRFRNRKTIKLKLFFLYTGARGYNLMYFVSISNEKS